MMIQDITPLSEHRLLVVSEDGRQGIFDLSPYLDYEVFQPLADPEAFKHVHNGRYFIEWDCGADLSADKLEAEWAEEQPSKVAL